MNLLSRVDTIMTKEVISVHPNSTLEEIENLFSKYKFHHIPVLREARLVGIVSKSDFLLFKRGYLTTDEEKRLEQERLRAHTADEIMTTGLATLQTEDKINVALEIFRKNYFHSIPILDGERLVGMLTTLDIIEHLAADREANESYS